jgi:hypothetical protein
LARQPRQPETIVCSAHNWPFDLELKEKKMSDDTFERKVMTPAERQAHKAFRQVDAEKAMTEHEIAQKAFSNNRERLKTERLAREAAELRAKSK